MYVSGCFMDVSGCFLDVLLMFMDVSGCFMDVYGCLWMFSGCFIDVYGCLWMFITIICGCFLPYSYGKSLEKPMLLMGQLTISTGPFSIAIPHASSMVYLLAKLGVF